MFGLFCCQSALDGKDVDDLCFEAAQSPCSEDGFSPDWPHACRVFARDDDHEHEGQELAHMKEGSADGGSSARSRLSTSRSLSPKRSSRSADGGRRTSEMSLAYHSCASPNAGGGERDPLILTDRSRSRQEAGIVKVKLVSVESARLAALKERRADRLRQSKEWEQQYHVVKENLQKVFASIAITAHCADPFPFIETQAPMSPPVGFPIMPESADLEYSQYSYAAPRAEEAAKNSAEDGHCHPEDAMPVSKASLVLQLHPTHFGDFVDKGAGGARPPDLHDPTDDEDARVTSI